MYRLRASRPCALTASSRSKACTSSDSTKAWEGLRVVLHELPENPRDLAPEGILDGLTRRTRPRTREFHRGCCGASGEWQRPGCVACLTPRVGSMHRPYGIGHPTNPNGSTGPNDEWHFHRGLCFVNGWPIRSRGAMNAARYGPAS